MGSDVLGGFIKGFTAGYALMQSKDEREYTRAKTEYTKAMAEYYKAGGSRKDTSARDSNYASMHEDRVARRAETARHNRAMEENARNPRKSATEYDPEESGAIPDPEMDPSFNPDFVEDEADPTLDPVTTDEFGVPQFARGGVVPPPKKRRKVMRYANGGGVVADDEEEKVAIPPVVSNAAAKQDRALPATPPPAPAAPPAAIPAPMGPGSPMATNAAEMQTPAGVLPAPTGAIQADQPAQPGFSYTAGFDAAQVAAETMAAEHGLDTDEAVPTGDENKKVEAYANDTKDMASPDQMETLRQKFDPNKQLSMDQVNMKVLGGVWEGFMKQGRPKEATQAAVALYKYYRAMYNRYSALAEAAGKGGKLDEAVQAKLQAYAYVPDGMEVELQKTKSGGYAYRYTDQKTGKVRSKGILRPEEMLSLVTHGGIGSFEELLAQGAGDPAIKAYTEAASPQTVKALGLEGAGSGDGAVGVPKPGPTNSEASTIAEDKRRRTEAAAKRVDESMPNGNGQSKETPFRVTSQEELDLLPGGTWVMVDGRVGQKKKASAPEAP